MTSALKEKLGPVGFCAISSRFSHSPHQANQLSNADHKPLTNCNKRAITHCFFGTMSALVTSPTKIYGENNAFTSEHKTTSFIPGTNSLPNWLRT